jgi:hypothetical protein
MGKNYHQAIAAVQSSLLARLPQAWGQLHLARFCTLWLAVGATCHVREFPGRLSTIPTGGCLRPRMGFAWNARFNIHENARFPHKFSKLALIFQMLHYFFMLITFHKYALNPQT